MYKNLKEGQDTNQDLFIIVTYVRPKLNNDKMQQQFGAIEKLLAELSCMGETVLMGDFNARTAELPDHITRDKTDSLPLAVNYIADEPIGRHNCDIKQANAYGRQLLEICKSSGHRILNGRTFGDSIITIHSTAVKGQPNRLCPRKRTPVPKDKLSRYSLNTNLTTANVAI